MPRISSLNTTVDFSDQKKHHVNVVVLDVKQQIHQKIVFSVFLYPVRKRRAMSSLVEEAWFCGSCLW